MDAETIIVQCFEQRGTDQYGSEAVTQRQHALQAAWLAEQASASSALCCAALLHDLGHLLPRDKAYANLDDEHESRGAAFLRSHFGPEVYEPVRLHVLAKRYLCTVDPAYRDRLSPTSLQSFLDQGGPLDAAAVRQFASGSFAAEAVQLRRWDDAAKDPQAETPPVEHFLPHIRNQRRA